MGRSTRRALIRVGFLLVSVRLELVRAVQELVEFLLQLSVLLVELLVLLLERRELVPVVVHAVVVPALLPTHSSR